MHPPFSQRRHLFEFGDQPWLTGWGREYYLDCLNTGLRLGGQFSSLHRVVSAWAARGQRREILDLGSGGGGPIVTLLRAAARDGATLPRIILSDLYPSAAHYEALKQEVGADRLDYVAEPVSALDVTRRDIRLRSICSSFHHFRPADAQALVEDAIRHSDGLLIVEPLQRNLRHFLLVLLSGPLPYMAAPFLAARWSWRRLLLCTLLPVFPLLVMFDGCVSVLRSYRRAELEAMIPHEARAGWQMDFTELPYGGLFATTCFALSRKQAAAGDTATSGR